MAQLLSEEATDSIMPAYIAKLLGAFEAEEPQSPNKSHLPAVASAQTLVEPLSERELDVLRLLRTELDGRAIAGELNVSLNTMRTHTKSIYTKLGMNNRRAAVRRAEELNLF